VDALRALLAERADGDRRRARDRRDILPKRDGRRLVLADLGAVPGPEALFELAVVHRTVPLLSAASIATCSRLSA